MAMKSIRTDAAPQPVAPYSQAVCAGNLVFVSGCLGLCPTTGLMRTETIQGETSLAIDNLERVLDAAGARLSHIVKVNIFVNDMALMTEINTVYRERFSPPLPARTAVAVKALPLGAHIEIEAIAMLDER
jgi:2-iminobutanoate/2-iminopropanoate deaminase